MNLSNNIIENLIESAYRRVYVFDKINDKLEIVVEHLIKCLLLNNIDSDNISHWMDEIYSALNVTYKLKNTNKLPTYVDLKKNCIDSFTDVLDNVIEVNVDNIEYKYSIQLKDKIYISILFDLIVEYYEWLMKEFSTIGRVTNRNVHLKIQELINTMNSKGYINN